MKIEIWSDVACPYCYIGFVYLQQALQQFEGAKPVVILRSFELEPDIATNSGESQYVAVMRKYLQSPVKAQQTLDAATTAGRGAGLTIDFEKVITTNTFDAHRLIHFAGTLGKGSEMKERLFQAYFSEGKHIGNKAVLTEIAAELGIDASEVMFSGRYAAEVRKDEHESYRLGVRGVPYYLFNQKHELSGAQSVATYLKLLNELKTEKWQPPAASDDNQAGTCNC